MFCSAPTQKFICKAFPYFVNIKTYLAKMLKSRQQKVGALLVVEKYSQP